jgi:putative transposase
MPGRAQTYLAGYPYHIVQRGNNREACFVESENYQYYLELWKECAKRYGVYVHAYCLMTDFGSCKICILNIHLNNESYTFSYDAT